MEQVYDFFWRPLRSQEPDRSGPQEHTFNARQEAVRKSVERVFGALFKRFNVLYHPSRLHHVESTRKLVLNSVIIQNMIVEARSCDYLGLIGDERRSDQQMKRKYAVYRKRAQLKSVWRNGERRP
jgi:Plant transposon protein